MGLQKSDQLITVLQRCQVLWKTEVRRIGLSWVDGHESVEEVLCIKDSLV